jgi:hypothetical protein
MNTIKFIVGVAVIGFALMGFITLDPAFKNAEKSNSTVKALSMNEQQFMDGFHTNLNQ